MHYAKKLLNICFQSKMVLNISKGIGHRSIKTTSVFYTTTGSLLVRNHILPEVTQLLHFNRYYTCYTSTDEDIVCYNELCEMRNSRHVVIIDVRNKDETLRTGTIPGSVCIPLDELDIALNMSDERFVDMYCSKKPSKDEEIVFLCKRGNRSFSAMKKAKEMGYNRSKFVQGGFINWFNEERLYRERHGNNDMK